MTISDALSEKGLSEIDKEVLLAHVCQKDRSWVLAHPEMVIDDVKWTDLSSRRKNQEPVAYIIGEKRFYGLPFTVDQRVLIPRPSTEGLIDLTLDFIDSGKEEIREIDSQIVGFSKKLGDLSDVKTIVDIGVGSGAIAVTLACERPHLRVIATDVSEDALAVARTNAKRHKVEDRIEFRAGNLLEPIADLEEPFVLVSNPPYIPDGEDVMVDVRDFEPTEALFAGPDGLDILSPLVAMTMEHPHCRGLVIECRKEQTEALGA